MVGSTRDAVEIIWRALGGGAEWPERPLIEGAGGLPSVFAVSDLAAASVGAACLGLAELIHARRGRRQRVSVDRRLASFWFGSSIRSRGWALPPSWDAMAGDYRAADGWIRLHTNARTTGPRRFQYWACRRTGSRLTLRWRPGPPVTWKMRLCSRVAALRQCAASRAGPSTHRARPSPRGRCCISRLRLQSRRQAGLCRPCCWVQPQRLGRPDSRAISAPTRGTRRSASYRPRARPGWCS